ncbi:ribonuclease H-like domain-containing protein [Tanacetum coccineum]
MLWSVTSKGRGEPTTRIIKTAYLHVLTQALTHPSWIEAMQDELLQFRLQKVWRLVDLPKGKAWPLEQNGIEAIRLFLAYASFMGFIVYQMDVKSAFLYGTIEEEVKQKDDGIFISQDKYMANILKKFDFVIMKTASTPTETNKALIKDEEAEESRMDGRTCNIKQMCVKSQTPRQVKRGRDIKIPQSGGLPEKVGDEAVH